MDTITQTMPQAGMGLFGAMMMRNSKERRDDDDDDDDNDDDVLVATPALDVAVRGGGVGQQVDLQVHHHRARVFVPRRDLQGAHGDGRVRQPSQFAQRLQGVGREGGRAK